MMNEKLPNDSILLPEGVVEDDLGAAALAAVYSDIVGGELLKEEKDDEKEKRK